MKKFLAIVLVTLITLSAVSALATSNDNPLYFLNSNDCVGWETNETRPLLPGSICIGDVIVAGTIRYDNGNNEDTIVINLSQKPVTITAPYGAQMQRYIPASPSDLMFQLALQEFARIEEKDGAYRYAFDTIRFVIIHENDAIEQLSLLTRADFFK